MRDYFADLGLTAKASLEEVKRAYKRLAKLFHPDAAGDREEFERVHEAYENLKSTTRIERVKKALGSATTALTVQKTDVRARAYQRRETKSEYHAALGPVERAESLDLRIVVVKEPLLNPGDIQEVPVSLERVCKDCRGKGDRSTSTRVRCQKCGGDGFHLIQRGSSFRWKKTCERCFGQGYEIKSACPQCQGYGKSSALEVVKLSVPESFDEPVAYRELGHYSFDGKSRGTLWVTWRMRL